MCCGKAFWKGIIAFGLTFGFGILASWGWGSVFQEQTSIQNAAVQPLFDQPNGLLEPKEFNKNSNPKPLCKQYGDDALFKLRLEHLIMTKTLENNPNLTSKNRKTYLKKIAELEKRFKKMKKKNTPSESKQVHNLLFVPNCEEY